MTGAEQLFHAKTSGRMWGGRLAGLPEGGPQAERYWGGYDFVQIILCRIGLPEAAEAFRESFEQAAGARGPRQRRLSE